jgi:hypothetical protein
MMVFTATTATQGQRDNDYGFCVDGELVIRHPSECSSGFADDACGCRRGLGGLASRVATTTFVATELDIDLADYATAIRDSLLCGGWDVSGILGDRVVRELAAEMQRVASAFEPGTVVERREDHYRARTGPLADRVVVSHAAGFADMLRAFRDRSLIG